MLKPDTFLPPKSPKSATAEKSEPSAAALLGSALLRLRRSHRPGERSTHTAIAADLGLDRSQWANCRSGTHDPRLGSVRKWLAAWAAMDGVPPVDLLLRHDGTVEVIPVVPTAAEQAAEFSTPETVRVPLVGGFTASHDRTCAGCGRGIHSQADGRAWVSTSTGAPDNLTAWCYTCAERTRPSAGALITAVGQRRATDSEGGGSRWRTVWAATAGTAGPAVLPQTPGDYAYYAKTGTWARLNPDQYTAAYLGSDPNTVPAGGW